MECINYSTFFSPLGWILLAAGSEGICLVDFTGSSEPSDERVHRIIHAVYPEARAEPGQHVPLLDAVRDAILRYLEDGVPIPDFPLDLRKGTEFQRNVWEALRRIPFGETRSYGDLATSLGRPGSARAVGRACGRNPLPLLVPCHRVVAAGGKLGGFSGGIHIKEALLDRETRK